jgi:hypothetical protein
MSFNLTVEDVQSILTTLCGSYDVDLGFGRIRLLARPLPGVAVCSILPDLGDGVLRLVYDIAKPNSFAHVQSMVREWWESFQEPVAFPDGSVELLRLPCPRAGEGPIRIAVLDD